jgi:phage baseplate assembly protein W
MSSPSVSNPPGAASPPTASFALADTFASMKFAPPAPEGFIGYGGSDLGSNWRVMFRDAEGIPLNMLSFELIDFGAISFKEIFQNAKTILATTIMSAALERTLGVDARIVDLPIGDAAQATIALMQALYFWEPRVEVMNIDFDADVINGHLIATLQLRVRNVLYGTDTPYTRANIFDVPTKVTQELPPMGPIVIQGDTIVIEGEKGEKGDKGERGSLWFADTGPPSTSPTVSKAKAQDMYLDTLTGDIHQMQSGTRSTSIAAQGDKGEPGDKGVRGSMWFFGASDPSDIADSQTYDLFLNTVTGDVWQLQGSTWRKVTNARRVE